MDFVSFDQGIQKGSKNCHTGKLIACGCTFILRRMPLTIFLEREIGELGMKRGKWGVKFPHPFTSMVGKLGKKYAFKE